MWRARPNWARILNPACATAWSLSGRQPHRGQQQMGILAPRAGTGDWFGQVVELAGDQ